MEDIVLTMPTADVAMLYEFAARMGWTIDRRQSAVSRFVNECLKNNASDMSDDDIQAEVNAVRYR